MANMMQRRGVDSERERIARVCIEAGCLPRGGEAAYKSFYDKFVESNPGVRTSFFRKRKTMAEQVHVGSDLRREIVRGDGGYYIFGIWDEAV
jgi:hypothetical protein